MGRTEEKRYEALSPFELKNKLIQMAKGRGEKTMLNAGRGNPNWVTMIPRKGFFQFGLFAVSESERIKHLPRLGNKPERNGIAKRFEKFIQENGNLPEVEFLKQAYDHVTQELKIDADDFILEMTDAILGDHYPMPDRMLTICERIVHKYLEREMWKGSPLKLLHTSHPEHSTVEKTGFMSFVQYLEVRGIISRQLAYLYLKYHPKSAEKFKPCQVKMVIALRKWSRTCQVMNEWSYSCPCDALSLFNRINFGYISLQYVTETSFPWQKRQFQNWENSSI